MDKITIRALSLALLFVVWAAVPAAAQGQLQGTQIMLGAPSQAQAGAVVTVQAVLADSQGHPISKAIIYFTTDSKFLGSSGDVVLAQAVTNAQGQAVAQLVDDFSGTATLSAEFRGDADYAPSATSLQISQTGGGQVYVEHIGVDLPGFNVPPAGAARAALSGPQPGIAGSIQGLWPAMNGWPVAAVLLLVWSMYLLAMTFVVRMAAAGDEHNDPASTWEGRQP